MWKLATYSTMSRTFISFSTNCMRWFRVLFCITSFCFRSPFHLRTANKTRQYNHPLWPLNLTACLLNTSSIRLWEASQFFFLSPSISSFPSPLFLYCLCAQLFLLSTCLSCCGLVWILWIPSPLQCIRLETPQMPALGKLRKKNKESDGMKMSVMANRTLSHSYNISVTDYQTGESNTHTHTQTMSGW